MKKLAVGIVTVLVLVLAFATTSSVFAQAGTPQRAAAGYGAGSELGYTMGNRGAGRGVGMVNGFESAAHTHDGILHDAMIEVYADALGLSVDDLNAKLAAGETLSEIAFAAGMSVEDFTALKVDARTAAIGLAVADGTLTQEQADWILQRAGGAMRGGAGGRGAGLGMNANADCPYYPQVQP